MADVFLSYRREERPKVEVLAQALKSLGLDVWFDLELVAGDAFPKVINEQLNSATAIVVCWSKGAVESDWVQGEAHRAHARGTYVSARIESCEPPVPFNAFQDADLITWSGAWSHEGLRALVVKLERLTKKSLLAQFEDLARQETTVIEQEVANEDNEEADEQPASTLAQQGSYVLDFVARNSQTGAKELAGSLAQIAFEEEILLDERTRWMVGVDATQRPNATHAVFLTSLREAITRAAPGDTIAILPGTYQGRFRIEKNIRLVGFGGKDVRPVLTGGNEVAAVDIKSNARLENLVFESRDTGHAACVSGGSPMFLRCVFDRQQLAESPSGCVHVSGRATPTFLACTIWSRYCPGIHFAGGALGTVIATDVVSNEADAVVVQARARPHFDRCEIRSMNGHAVVSANTATGRFENCALRAIDAAVIVNYGGAYPRFVGNRISVRRGSLVELRDAARGVFERNRMEPDPEAKSHWEERERERKKVFRNQEIMRRPIPRPITAGAFHRAKFAQNRLPSGAVLDPTAETPTLH